MYNCSKCLKQFTTKCGKTRHENLCNATLGTIEKIKHLYKEGNSINDLRRLGFQRYTIITAIKGIARSKKETAKIKGFNRNGYWKCEKCGKREFTKLQSYLGHKSHCGRKRNRTHWGWNKGLTKFTDERIAAAGKKYSANQKGKKRKPLTEEHKEKIRKALIKAHKEGRAYNYGINSWHKEPSYPEKFWKEVIENEFEDKNYVFQLVIYPYRVDFAWKHKMKIIEIDGVQHEKRKEKDQKRDAFLKSKGWQILRLKWNGIFYQTKESIEEAKKFIDL